MRDGEVGDVRVLTPASGSIRAFYGPHPVNTPDHLEDAQDALLALVLDRGWFRSRTQA